MEGEGDLVLEINEESLHNKLLEHKNHIGFNCAEGSLIIASGLAFVYTIVSGKINNNILNIVSWCFAIGQIIYGLAQVIIALKTKFNAEKLYREIVKLDVSAHRYSLIAIKDSFMGYKSNRILTKYFEGKWNEYMFLSFPTAAERDEESLKNAIGAALKIPRDVIHLHQKASIYQPKISQDWNTVRAYYNTYYVVYIDSFPELLKNNEFEIDGVHYKWMTLEQMEREAEKKEHNKNERRTFARYIFTPDRHTDLYSEPRKNTWKMPYNVCIRLNRKCDLSCKFCLACSENTLMLSTDVVKQCLCLLKNNGVRRARLGGGEPTRHPGFMEIVRYSVNLGMDTIVYSNLYDVDKIIPELIRYPIRVVTSLHGDESFHDFITQTEEAYQRTYNNIVKLVSYNIPVTIHMVLMNENVHMVEQVVVEAIKIGVDKVTIQTLIPCERGREFIEENHATVFMLRQNLEKVRYLGEKGLIGRNNVMFTLSLAYFSSGYSIETCEYNMFEFNNRLDQPLEEKEVIKLVRSAYSENYQGANREYITILCKAWVSSDLTSKDLFVRQGWFKFKKKRSERQRVHLSEWKEDLMAYISEKSDVYKPYLVTTKKEIREALGIPERTLDKLLKVLKANQEIFFKIKPGRNGGIQLASVKSLLLSIIKVKKEEKESYIKALSEFFDLEHTFIQETLNKLAERPKTDTQLDLFSYDTG